MGSMEQIDSSLAEALGVDPQCVPPTPGKRLDSLLSQTSRQERRSLYALTRYGYSGEGDIFDVGCAAGGSTACLAAGVADGSIEPKYARVHAFDLFSGYSTKAFASQIAAQQLEFASDLELFAHQVAANSAVVRAHQLDLTKPFRQRASKKALEIVHIDAAKSQELWTSIISEIGSSVIPGKTIWIFQDFERVRLPWHVWGLDSLLAYGRIIGGAQLGTLYFRFDEAPPASLINRIACHELSIEDALGAVNRVYDMISSQWAQHFEVDGLSLDDFRIGSTAYCHFWLGDQDTARELFLGTSERFRRHEGSVVYLRELGIT